MKLKDKADRSAQFKTVITFCDQNQEVQFTGIVSGRISEEARGEHGFGYDPIFEPEDLERTFAEMELAEKNNYSHRARALAQLLSFLEKM